MAHISPLKRARELETQLTHLAATMDVDALRPAERELLLRITHQATDARLDVRDYEYAETRAEQLRLAKEARSRLEALQEDIVEASKYSLFSAIDVAATSAGLQQIIAALE